MDKPIIFNAPMVRALLDGRKTQTRRVLKPWPGEQAKWLSSELLHRAPSCYLGTVDGHLGAQMQHPLAGQWSGEVYIDPMSPLTWVRLPYAPGYRLWVRERCRAVEHEDGADAVEYLADNACARIQNTAQAAEQWGALYHYGKCGPDRTHREGQEVPSIHMPRWASRLTLTVTDVRVQRLQDISEADAKAEGVNPAEDPNDRKWEHYVPHGVAFKDLWNTIHGPGAWDANPWVAAYTFTVHKGNIDEPRSD